MKTCSLILIVLVILAGGCSWTVPVVQVNIGKNDVSNALLSADKGPRVESVYTVGDHSTVTTEQPDGPELSDKETNALDALGNLERAFERKE